MPNRRERAKRDKQERIHQAAAELFAERGYVHVTTQDIADRADVAGGTLFRYAASKAELLLMVVNDDLGRAIDQGRSTAVVETDVVDRIVGLLEPLVASGVRHRENTMVYQREILFGEPGKYRAAGLELVNRLQAAIADTLRATRTADGEPAILRDGVDADLAARSIFALLHLDLIHSGLAEQLAAGAQGDLKTQIRLMIEGICTPIA